jgi:hypothetical protein
MVLDPFHDSAFAVIECLFDGAESISLVEELLEGTEPTLSRAQIQTELDALRALGFVAVSPTIRIPTRDGAELERAWYVTERGWAAMAASGRYEPEPHHFAGYEPPRTAVIARLLREGPKTLDELEEPASALLDDPHLRRQHKLESLVGSLALDGAAAADEQPGGDLRWRLTEAGDDALRRYEAAD